MPAKHQLPAVGTPAAAKMVGHDIQPRRRTTALSNQRRALKVVAVLSRCADRIGQVVVDADFEEALLLEVPVNQ